MSDMKFSVKKKKKITVTFQIGGEPADDFQYTFTAPKRAGMLTPVLDRRDGMDQVGVVRAQYDWLREGLRQPEKDENGQTVTDDSGDPLWDESQWERIMDRLRDPDDDLDSDDIEGVIEWISEKINDRPTTSRRGSGR